MQIKHIIWDWNGTLLDDLWLSVKAINIVLEQYHLPLIDSGRYLKIFSFPVIDYYKHLGFDLNKNPFTVVGTEFIEEYTARMYQPELHPGVAKIMDYASSKGITQSLLSAAGQQMLEDLMDHHNLRHRFLKIIGQDNHYAYGKIQAGQAWMKELHYTPHEVLFVGDTIHDLEVADAIGADCVLISGGHVSHERLVSTGAKVFKNISEFHNWLDTNHQTDSS